MGAFSRLRYVIAANVNSLIEKAEDPEKLLRALIREMEDASEDARQACANSTSPGLKPSWPKSLTSGRAGPKKP
jgi:phage shock protein A